MLHARSTVQRLHCPPAVPAAAGGLELPDDALEASDVGVVDGPGTAVATSVGLAMIAWQVRAHWTEWQDPGEQAETSSQPNRSEDLGHVGAPAEVEDVDRRGLALESTLFSIRDERGNGGR